VDPQLHIGVDKYNYPVSTDSDHAQRWFDQGLQLTYGFHHLEALRSYRRALEFDPNLAIAWWGIAYAMGPNLNDPAISAERHEQAYHAAQNALGLIDHAGPKEQALIHAIASRYAPELPEDVTSLNEAYAAGMRSAFEQFPDDPDIGSLYADSLMNLQPWDYWTADDQPKGNVHEIVATLEHVLANEEDHPAATHLYIHAMEAGPEPEKAVPSGDRLLTRIPGSGHLVHMPSHIYAVVGRWSDAADSNEAAIARDLATMANTTDEDFYWGYYGHNLHFLAYASMMECRYDSSIRAARQLWNSIPESFIKNQGWFVEGIMPTTYHVMIRFGRWDDILNEPSPPSYMRVSQAVHHYSRSIAHSALGNTLDAQLEFDLFEDAAANIPEHWLQFNNKINEIIPIARNMALAELRFREGSQDEAVRLLREAAVMEDNLVYDEPPAWMIPVRHPLGAFLVSMGRYAEAEQVYTEDLERNPHNGWGLLGMEQALIGLERFDEAEEFAQRRQKAWYRADVEPTSSCLCEPGVTFQ
jgi:tetratricopeptide (TPR) repeat protein